MSTSQNINTLARFLGRRDLTSLTPAALTKFQLQQVDVLVLFGGSILAGADLFAEAINNQVAKKYLIVGGAGHTTDALRQQIQAEYPQIQTADQPEAVIFNQYLQHKYGLQADYLETKSTNCGNNITYLLDLLEQQDLSSDSIILLQDATMQLRMASCLRKYRSTQIFNFATYQATVAGPDLHFTEKIHGMWSMERYISLLLGEIPRLRDDQFGYGPRGKNFIAHVEIPAAVEQAFTDLSQAYNVRVANDKYRN